MNIAKNTTSYRLILAIFFIVLSVVGSGSVACGGLFNAPGRETFGKALGVDKIDTLITTSARQRRIWQLTDPKAFKYLQNPKHGAVARAGANAEPQDALNVLQNNSVWLNADTTVRRIGVDKINKEFGICCL